MVSLFLPGSIDTDDIQELTQRGKEGGNWVEFALVKEQGCSSRLQTVALRNSRPISQG